MNGISDIQGGVTAYALPPEFLALGLDFEPWHPTDSLAIIKLVNFHLSYNWSQDLLRDIFSSLEGGQLEDLVEELVPFNLEGSYNLVTILDEEDVIKEGLHADSSLTERYQTKEVHDWEPKDTSKE